MEVRSAILNVMIRAAEKAARRLVRDFGEVEQLQVSRKGPSDFVSQADLMAEKTIREELARARPDYGFLMEESGSTPGRDSDIRWIVDPLDGTTNFLHGLPHWCISIAVETRGEITAGVIHDPVKDETFYAEKGSGAFLNARRLRVSGRHDLSSAVLATGIPFQGSKHPQKEFLSEMDLLMGQVAGIRRFGAAALDLAYVAAGRYEGYWESGVNSWDVAAGVLIVKEAGGFVSSLTGDRNPVTSGSLLATNDPLHRPLLKLLQSTRGTDKPAARA